jgi:pilus assembly protein CpaE
MTPPTGLMSPAAQDAAEKSLRVLIVGSDRSLEEEFQSALAAVPDRQGVVYFADTHRDALEVARRRQPDFVVIEIDRDVADIVGLTRELQELVPASPVAGAFRQDRLDQGRSDGATLIELLRAQMRDFIRRPVSTTELRAVLDRLFPRSAGPALQQGRVAAFLSNKGGVGKSVLAVNVACALALKHPDDVLLVDASLQLGACAFMLDLKPATSIVDAIHERERLDKTLLRHLSIKHESGLRLLAAPTDALDGAQVDDEAIGRVISLARRSFKYVIVDTFPLIDSVLMTVLDLADLAFVVVQGTAPSVAGIARVLPVLEGLGLGASRQRLVLNYNYRSFLGNLKPADIASRLQRDFDYVVPYDERVLVSMNTGSPQILHARRWHRFGRAINQIADDLDALTANGAAEPGGSQGPAASRARDVAVEGRESRLERMK